MSQVLFYVSKIIPFKRFDVFLIRDKCFQIGNDFRDVLSLLGISKVGGSFRQTVCKEIYEKTYIIVRGKELFLDQYKINH